MALDVICVGALPRVALPEQSFSLAHPRPSSPTCQQHYLYREDRPDVSNALLQSVLRADVLESYSDLG